MCKEAQKELASSGDKTCSLAKCKVETELRCPFRDLVRARANQFIKNIAVNAEIWDAEKAAGACDRWYGNELANVTHIGAVWDVLQMLPCPNDEAAIRTAPCFQIETANVAPTHPMAKFCYTSFPVDLNIGLTVSTQCCYGADLKLLVLGHKGAGSVDFSSKLSQHESTDADHFLNDLYPNLACCALSDNCYKYSAVRPAQLVPETAAEVAESCKVMKDTYDWRPYKSFQPPYARRAAIEEWAKLKLGQGSLVPTPKVGDLLKQAQDVRRRIHAGQEPYPEVATTEKPVAASTAHKATTEEPEPTTHKTTEEAEGTTRHTTVDEDHGKTTARPAKKESEDKSVKENIDKAIEAVLQGQTQADKKESDKGKEETEHKNAKSSGSKESNGKEEHH